MRKFILCSLVFSFYTALTQNLFAWDPEVYESLRDQAVVAFGGSISIKKNADKLRHFSWDPQKNKIAQSVANTVASAEDAKERATRFWRVYNSLKNKFRLDRDKHGYDGFDPYINVELALSLAEKASASESLTQTFLKKSSDLPSMMQESSKKLKDQYLAAYDDAVSESLENREHMEFAGEKTPASRELIHSKPH